ncbi:hypothetical protein [Streptomyces sp. SAJ15]|uniref:hypothetical protein n=1 Tax=Streptomyces sp. SAJ15 TaxID=2011095 RepID=UPI0011852AB1|nr:hypothetical protein [Streptomyces sp. SAJ15]TVL88450.1 hypothetical protein CD790_30845 [Streptomyces sp. SAJ15]
MSTRDASFRWRLLLNALVALAADADTQLAWLDKYQVEADELALDFDHAFRMADSMQADGLLDEKTMDRLRLIDTIFEAMSGPDCADRWSPEALAAEATWGEVKELARSVLAALQVDWQGPMPEIHVVR